MSYVPQGRVDGALRRRKRCAVLPPTPPGGERVLACGPIEIWRLKCDPHPEGEGAELRTRSATTPNRLPTKAGGERQN